VAAFASVLFLSAAVGAEAEPVSTIRGSVVGADDRPVAKTAVEARRWIHRRKTTTDDRGQFELAVPTSWLKASLAVVASRDGGKEQAYRHSWQEKDWGQPLRLRLRPARRIEVRVVDGAGRPVGGARVGALADYSNLFSATTDAKGQAAGWVPADAPLQTVCAFMGGKGLDYRAYQAGRPRGRGGKPPPPSPPEGPLVLTLDGAAPLKLRVQDPEGKPLANVPVYPWYLQKPGEPADINLSPLGDEVQVKTAPDGVAVFDWLPAWEKRVITFFPMTETHVRRRARHDPKAGKDTLTLTLDRLVRIGGRVLLPDGKPAAGIRVEANGDGYFDDRFDGEARTDKDGRWEMKAYPNHLYMAGVRDAKWAAPARDGFAVYPDRPVTGLDFQLRPATRVHGRVTLGPDRKPVAGQWMVLHQRGRWLGELKGVTLPNPEGSRKAIIPMLWLRATTGADGGYEFHLGPGAYELRGPSQAEVKKFEVKDEKAVALDFHAARPEEGRLTGRVVTGTPPKPVAGAVVRGIYRHSLAGGDLTAKTDKEGRFEVTRRLHRTVLHARSADKRLAGVVEIGEDAKDVTIPVQPLGSARGRLVDPDGKPLAGREIVYGVHVGDENSGWVTSFGGKTKTDKDGHFALSDLIVGQRYHISVTVGEDTWRTVGQVNVKDAKPVSLGNLVLAPPRKPPTLDERIRDALGSKQTPRERFAAAVADARLSRQHVLVVFAEEGSAATKAFFTLRYQDDGIRDLLDPYRVVAVPTGKGAEDLARHLGVGLEKKTFPLLLVHDGDKRVAEASAAGKDDGVPRDDLAAFLKKHAPTPLDARKLLADALARARKENKRVLVQETATWCGPCWSLSRFLDRHRGVWSKDYLWVKIDHRWARATEVMKEIRKGNGGGIPWTAILDADGKVLATSNDAKGNNVGFPSSGPGIEHFLSMIRKTSTRLTDDEIATIGKALAQPSGR
jgi:protocatechuate 3,4-dioxygenase beta subunit